jgi:hypothetical protein
MTHIRNTDPQFDCFEVTPITKPFTRFMPFSDVIRRSAAGTDDPSPENRKTKLKDFFRPRRMK